MQAQGAVTETIPKKEKCKKTKRLSEKALQIAEERREVKNKGEREKYTLLNAEFWRKVQRHKKAFFNVQCTEVEENTRMGKNRNLFKDMKGTFQARMGTIKERNSKDLTEVEEINTRRWQKYTELYKNGLNDQDNNDGVVTHLESDILV